MRASPWRFAAALAALWLGLAAPRAHAAEAMAALQQRAQAWLQQGFDAPQRVLAEIDVALEVQDPDRARARILQRTRGAVAARAGRAGEVQATLEALDRLDAAGDALARPDAALVRALSEENLGRSAAAVEQAREAAEGYAVTCGRTLARRADCDPYAHWLALHTWMMRGRADVELEAALARGDEAIAIAQRAHDPALQALTLATQASLCAARGDPARARRLVAQADALLQDAGRPEVETRVELLRMRITSAEGDDDATERALEAAFAAARRARSPRLLASVQVSASDWLVRRGRAAEALAAVQSALPVARRAGDRRIERLLRHNGTLAHIALGQGRDARRQVGLLLETWTADGTPGEQSIALREVADALAAAGDPRTALELYHRERESTERVMATQREAAERSLRQRYDRDSEQRLIEIRARDNAIQGAELQNRTLTERLWALAAVAVGLGGLLLVLTLRRMRATRSALKSTQAQLRLQSERDPLTAAANRRCGQLRLDDETRAAGGAWRGSMLLVDVDHFKRVNDTHGHAVGDQVLVEVARRLQSAMRGGDLLVRWGGEEFLVLASGTRGQALEALARRLMLAVGATPLRLDDGTAVAVTVSIGHGAFPLAQRGAPLGWERALHLVDMALYLAKSQGRHRAVGVVELADEDALAHAERDLARAWNEGQVRLVIEAGA